MLTLDSQNCITIDLHRGTTHDGPGSRTTVFFKGCPLHCQWCQNPEGIEFKQEVWWEERKCIHCLSCIEACSLDAIHDTPDGLRIDREICTVCGACVEACPSRAMAFTGREWSIDQLIAQVLKDKEYYTAFGGGVTVSGGEPLGQVRFVSEFFRRLQELGIHTALDTCGLAPAVAFDTVLPYTDHLLYDIKLIDPVLHKQYTEHSNQTILDNLLYVCDTYLRSNPGKRKLWIRTPLIPGVTATEENITAIGHFIRENILDVLERWELCSFNSACNNKYKKMGDQWAFKDLKLMTQAEIDAVKATAIASGIPAEKVVISGLVAKEK